MNELSYKVAVVGTGYVGKPLIDELSLSFEVIAYDINQEKIKNYISENNNDNIHYTFDEKELRKAKVIIVCVPTPVDVNNIPNLEFINLACKNIGENITKGTLVIFESSYMPTCTETHCIPLLEKYSQMKCDNDFYVGYSPERINPGDKVNTLNSITKLIAASSLEVLERMEDVYSRIDGINLYRVSDIKVAELSKLVENCQRDINIAFVNELSRLCHKLGIDVNDVLDSAATKWNFMRYNPGLVGGDCVGVNSYYLMNLAGQYGETLEVLNMARTVNLEMSKFIVDELDNIVSDIDKNTKAKDIKVTIYGYTYKENIPDVRNTRVIDLYNELVKRGYNTYVCDYIVSPQNCKCKVEVEDILDNDVIILAVPHDKYVSWDVGEIVKKYKNKSKYKVFMDIKSKYKDGNISDELIYWNL